MSIRNTLFRACEKCCCAVFFFRLYFVANKNQNELSCMGFFTLWKNNKDFVFVHQNKNRFDRSKHAHDRIDEGKKHAVVCVICNGSFFNCFCFEIRKTEWECSTVYILSVRPIRNQPNRARSKTSLNNSFSFSFALSFALPVTYTRNTVRA